MKKLVSIIISLFFVFSSAICVNSAELNVVQPTDYYEPLNSWRYHNGVPYSSFSLGASSNNQWKKTDKGIKWDSPWGKGIDVSQWNGDIDWAKVAASDVDYAIIRCGFGDNLEYQDDAYFQKNVEGCINNKIPPKSTKRTTLAITSPLFDNRLIRRKNAKIPKAINIPPEIFIE